MPSFFSRLKGRDGPAKVAKNKKAGQQTGFSEEPPKPMWEDAWTRKTVEPEEVQDLVRGCTVELKSRGMLKLRLTSSRYRYQIDNAGDLYHTFMHWGYTG